MGNQCALCGRPVNLISRAKILDGDICGKCLAKLPKVFSAGSLNNLNTEDIRNILFYNTEINKMDFEVTASYGKLHIDESKGIFFISDKIAENKPNDLTSVFYVLDLEEASIYVNNPKVQKDNSVKVDAELSCVFSGRLNHLAFKAKIDSGVKCYSKKIDKTHLDWFEPSDLSVFRNMFNQMIQNEQNKIQKQLNGYITREDVDRYKAKSVFLLGPEYTKEELDCKKEKLLKAFADDFESIRKINYYYTLLIKEFWLWIKD